MNRRSIGLLSGSNRNATHGETPELWGLLDLWAGLDETTWTQEQVDELRGKILRAFKCPGSDRVYQEWRSQRPGVRLS